ncbi:MAG: GNAT family N-acetyltransferase [Acidimicrobiia bacterium]|nr:GNAT family N-acetyltransferase [Acidimicrobiia bacterium]
MLIREVAADEVDLCATLGRFVVESYTTLPGHVPEPDYERELADVAARAALPETVVLAAFDGAGRPLGSVTYAGPGSPMVEHAESGAASFRMLGVDPAAQGRGAGAALVQACIDRASVDGYTSIVLHSTPWMTTAHRIYTRFGFTRDESLEWTPVPGIDLWAFRLPL